MTRIRATLKAALPLACAALTSAAAAAGPGASAAPALSTSAATTERELRRGDIEVYVKVSGIATAQDTYDILAPFDGRAEEVMPELFEYVTPQKTAAKIVSSEMAALLDSSSPQDRALAEKRWEGVYKYYDLRPESPGIVSGVYVKPKDTVHTGDRLFTVARKIVIIGRNTEPLYSQLAAGMPADMFFAKDPSVKLQADLSGFVPVQNSPYYNRVWLTARDLSGGMRIGERFNGYLFVGHSENTLMVPRKALVEKNGSKYLLLEVETGLATGEETEIIKSGTHFLAPDGSTYGKTEKAK